ncbi:MAG: hypothetical protein JSR76_07085 [Verrucomicrobia bacterium]|nr:hypothetical protein [Verrucomicrobiota bacterium]
MAKDVPNIEGPSDPKRFSETEKSSAHADKFKKIMKVDESDETQKRQKRNLPRQEEGDDEDVTETQDNKKPVSSFGSYLKDPSPTDSIFSAEDGSAIPVNPSGESTAPYTIPEAELPRDDSTPPLAAPTFLFPSSNLDFQGDMDVSEVDPSSDRKKNSDSPSPPTPSKKKPLGAKASPFGEEEKKITTKHLEAKPFDKKEPHLHLPKKTEKEKVEDAGSGLTNFEPERPKAPPPLPPEPLEKNMLEAKKIKTHELHKEKEEPPLQTPLTGPDTLFALNKADAIPIPSYTMLPSHVFELFERMVGYMTIEQNKGVSETTIKLSMPGSVFHNCELVIQHYDTAPSSFNVQLLGTPQAVTIFRDNLQDLATAFKQSNLPYHVNLKNPILLEESRPVLRRKAKGGEKESDSRNKKQR